MRYLFVGEKRSEKAKRMRVTWADGRLAAKQLFDGLLAAGIDPAKQHFTNWFEGGKNKVRTSTLPIVAMGNKVSSALKKEGIKHIKIVHPASRGAIRRKKNYINHIKEMLL